MNDISLPKWPCLLVTGDRVSPTLAAEIIMRTDRRFPNMDGACNDEDTCREMSEIFGIPKEPAYGSDNRVEQSDNRYTKLNKLDVAYSKLDLQYMHNSRIASCWYGGVHGWCNWNGEIFAANYNIGKWPCVEDVLADLQKIAAAFPSLRMDVQLLNHECCYPRENEQNGPVVLFHVANGTVAAEAQLPTDRCIAAQVEVNPEYIGDKEIGISPKKLREWCVEIFGEDFPTYNSVG